MPANEVYPTEHLASASWTSTRLFPFEPIGIGTFMAESLPSYIVRLARAHYLQTSDLYHQLLDPAGPRGWNHITIASETEDLVSRMADLTGNDIAFTTFQPWVQFLSLQGLPRRSQAWCRMCYEEWYRARRRCYIPMMWLVASVSACPAPP